MDNQHISDIIISDNIYELWQLNDQEPHSLGLDNGESGTLWVKEKYLSENSENEWIPWLDSSSNRDCWDINISQRNTMKYKWNSNSINNSTTAIIKLNNKQVYEITMTDLDACFNEARSLIYKLNDLIYNSGVDLNNFNSIIGRKIYYKDLPGKINRVHSDGSVCIQPDCNEDELEYWWNELRPPWEDSDDYWEELKRGGEIKDNILTTNIFWYRNDREVKLNKIKRAIQRNGKS